MLCERTPCLICLHPFHADGLACSICGWEPDVEAEANPAAPSDLNGLSVSEAKRLIDTAGPSLLKEFIDASRVKRERMRVRFLS